jgi:hypothetical protein
VPEREPESYWPAEIHHVDGELAHLKLVKQLVDHLGEMIEGVRETRPVRHSAVPECRIVGRDDVILVCELRDQPQTFSRDIAGLLATSLNRAVASLLESGMTSRLASLITQVAARERRRSSS